MANMSLKEYYKEKFKEIIQEINENEKSVKNYITIEN